MLLEIDELLQDEVQFEGLHIWWFGVALEDGALCERCAEDEAAGQARQDFFGELKSIDI